MSRRRHTHRRRWLGTLRRGSTIGLLAALSAPALVWAQAPAPAADVQQALDAGQESFYQGDFAGAATAWRKAAEAAPQNPQIWYALGTAEAQADRLGPAMHALEQAVLLAPGDDDAAHNLDEVRARIVSQALADGSDGRVILPGEDDAGTGLMTALPPRVLGIAFAISWALLFLTLHLARRVTRAGRRTAATFAGVLFGLFALGSGGLLWGRSTLVDSRIYGVVERPVKSHQGPGAQYPSVAKVLEGVKVRLSGAEGQWRQVVMPDGSGAWLPDDAVRPLHRPE